MVAARAKLPSTLSSALNPWVITRPTLTPNAVVALKFIEGVLGVTLWDKPHDIVRAVFGPKKITGVKSAHGVGKTFTAAACALAWLFTAPNRGVITTAPTWRQVKDLLWKEIRAMHAGARLPLGGRVLPSDPRLVLTDEWKAVGFASNDPVNMQGDHFKGGTLVIFDEAPGVEANIWDALKGVITGPLDRMLAIGNPTVTSGPFKDLFDDPDRHQAECITISAYDSPNVREGRQVIPGLVSREWVEAREREWGRGSPMFRARVLGEFPTQADNTLADLAWVEQANIRWQRLTDAKAWAGPWRLGVDVARFGDAQTIRAFASMPVDPKTREAFPQGIERLVKHSKRDTMETSGLVALDMKDPRRPVFQARIDGDGLGAGVFDALSEQFNPQLNRPGTRRVIEMRGGMAAADPSQFFNARSEWLWHVRDLLDPAGPYASRLIALPPDDKLRGQLTGIVWSMNRKGLRQLESKDDMRGRGVASPDELDACAYALAELETGKTFTVINPSGPHTRFAGERKSEFMDA